MNSGRVWLKDDNFAGNEGSVGRENYFDLKQADISYHSNVLYL
jgi:hypothetical protein